MLVRQPTGQRTFAAPDQTSRRRACCLLSLLVVLPYCSSPDLTSRGLLSHRGGSACATASSRLSIRITSGIRYKSAKRRLEQCVLSDRLAACAEISRATAEVKQTQPASSNQAQTGTLHVQESCWYLKHEALNHDSSQLPSSQGEASAHFKGRQQQQQTKTEAFKGTTCRLKGTTHAENQCEPQYSAKKQ